MKPTYKETLASPCGCPDKARPLGRHFQRLAVTGEQSDITVTLHGRIYSLHRAILTQSPMFAALLNDDWHVPQDGCGLRLEFTLSKDTSGGFENTLYAWESALVALYDGCSGLMASPAIYFAA
ncbi:hypothetical protein H9P43_000124 [Blastocladiella emersonii ATCC 22665]|nr:hypothetical protein H9P43_000124 [Blastocladiella emersonii ATCC 22665]